MSPNPEEDTDGEVPDHHTRALASIAEQAKDNSRVPQVAFAAFVYETDTDFIHSTDGTTEMVAVLDGLATHIAALSEASGRPVREVVDVAGDMAQDKRDDGLQDRTDHDATE